MVSAQPLLAVDQSPLLATKILVPSPGSALIDRPRLLRLLDTALTKQVTVIKAPGGFGKSTLAAAWAAQLRSDGNLVAWLRLEADDDQSARFLFYLGHALRRACHDVGKAVTDLVTETSLIRAQTVVSTLVNELVELEDDLFLFLDDYHCISNPAIHEGMAYLLKHAPVQFHLVLGTRLDPPLPIALLRAQNQLVEIDATTLRFDVEETRRFLNREKMGPADAQTVKLLNDKTEGWPAVLRIVASTSASSGEELSQYVQGLSTALRPIGAYLDEMLDGLPSELFLFLLRTSILERMSAPLCQAVTGARSAETLLAAMESRQLMLAHDGAQGEWCRYHPLLAEHLRQRLDADFAIEIPLLHRRAAAWFAEHELWTDAVQHAIAAGDTEQAARWIEKCAMTLVKRGDMLTLLDWQRLFPADLIRAQIKLRIAIAWGMALAMRFEEAAELVVEIQKDIENGRADSDALLVECAAIKSVTTALADDSSTALSLAEACMRQSRDPWTANVASNVARFGYWKAGDLKSFYATPWIPYSLDEDKWNVFASVYRLCLQALVEHDQLRMPTAESFIVQSLSLAQQHVGPNSLAAALPASLTAAVRYEQGRLDEAEAILIDRMAVINSAAMLECVARSYSVLAKVAASRHNRDRAYALLDRAEALAAPRKWGRLLALVHFLRLRLYLADRRLMEGAGYQERLERVAAEYPAPAPCAWSSIHCMAARGRAYLALAEGRPQDAVAALEHLGSTDDSLERSDVSLSTALQLSVALHEAGATADAALLFARVLRAAHSAGLYQSIVDEGPEIASLLANFQERTRRAEDPQLLSYAGTLLEACRRRHEVRHVPAPVSATNEPLSRREQDILELIAQGRSNKEIARSFGIGPETVKTHVKKIFIKLSVEKRAQAVSRAQSLGLVSTEVE
jgi:LuxR family transcriptional regulator, maltose regulon positive regulatory protein